MIRLLVAALSLAPLAPSAPAQPTDVASALSSISATRIESDLQFLASTALEGRGTPSPGLEVAALYIKARLERLGYEPGGPEGFWHEYPLVLQQIDMEASCVELSSAEGEARLEFGSDYFLKSGELEALDLRGEIVSIGDGSVESLEQADLKGRWALLLDEGRITRRAVRQVAEAGGIGVIIAAGEDYSRKPFAERYGVAARALMEGHVMKLEHKAAVASSPIPRLWLSESGMQRLLALASQFEGSLPAAGSTMGVELRELRVPGGGEVIVRNVCGFLPGSDPALTHETLVVSAHYDHLGERSGTIYPGADDNASGTSGLLALAAALKENGPLDRSVLLLWVSGEEKGLWGSEAWAKEAWLPDSAHAVANINMDMIGRTEPRELYVTPSRDHSHFNPVAALCYELAGLEGFDEPASQDEYWRSSDHFNFSSILEIPVAFLSSGDHDDYHQSTDTPDKIDSDKIARTVALVLRMLDRLQDAEL